MERWGKAPASADLGLKNQTIVRIDAEDGSSSPPTENSPAMNDSSTTMVRLTHTGD